MYALRMASVVALFIFSVFLIIYLAWIVKTIYTVFVKKKDRRMKRIVLRSMFQTLIVVAIFYGIHGFLTLFEGTHLFLNAFRDSLYIHPIILYLLLLGAVIKANKSRNGGEAHGVDE